MHSKDKLCPEIDLLWVDREFELLEIFHMDLEKIVELNYEEIYAKQKKTCVGLELKISNAIGKIYYNKILSAGYFYPPYFQSFQVLVKPF